MPKYIYLYGPGETQINDELIKTVDDCYIKCEIPDDIIKNGFFPSVLHAYIMYAKDIGLTVTDILYSRNLSKELDQQLVYSLWSLIYVNNSEQFTAQAGSIGMSVWEIATQNKTVINTKQTYNVKLDPELGCFYRDSSQAGLTATFNNQSTNQALPKPAPGNHVTINTLKPWNLELPTPEPGGNEATSYAINLHYNECVIWQTLLNMQQVLNLNTSEKTYRGLRQASSQVLTAVVDRPYAYDAMVPKWSNHWGAKPDYYDAMRTSMNNYNIGASLFESPTTQDPEISNLQLLGTALNIKGKIKAGHAETRLLLTLDTIDFANRGNYSAWFTDVCDFYDFSAESVEMDAIYNQYKHRSLSLISSLKPCYLCIGEVEATEDGWIKSVDDYPVDMWACFPELSYQPKIKQVLYFDIDRPIDYPSYLETTIYVANKKPFNWSIYLVPWNQWTGFLYPASNFKKSLIEPIGPRVVEPAGECLKTGEAFTRYKNSAYLLSQSEDAYIDQLNNLSTGYVDLQEEEL